MIEAAYPYKPSVHAAARCAFFCLFALACADCIPNSRCTRCIYWHKGSSLGDIFKSTQLVFDIRWVRMIRAPCDPPQDERKMQLKQCM
jgi:hypothetical protein